MSIAGNLLWTNNKDISIALDWDKIAVDPVDRLVFVSAVGYAQMAKAFRAALASQLKDPIALKMDGRGAFLQVEGKEQPERQPTANCHAGGYMINAVRLGRDMLHVTAVARSTGLIMNDTEEALWQELKEPRFETPLLRSWVPHIRKRLIAAEMLEPCYCHDCSLWTLACRTKDLDEIVVDGLRSGELKIQPEAA